MTLLVLLDIIGREVLQTSFPWAQKSAVYLMIWMGFVGACLTSAKGAHLRPEIADKLWRGVGKTLSQFLEQALIATFCGGMAYLAWDYVGESKTMGDLSVVTGTPMWMIQAAIPYTFASMAIRHSFYAFFPGLKPIRSVEDHK
jgi:TRAP-type C4-dicarboxylate transport system permease small subunit